MQKINDIVFACVCFCVYVYMFRWGAAFNSRLFCQLCPADLSTKVHAYLALLTLLSSMSARVSVINWRIEPLTTFYQKKDFILFCT